jgi:hypothetical protein
MKSKLLPVVVLILWFGAHGSSAQDGSVIIAIRAEVAQINGSLSTCTKTTTILFFQRRARKSSARQNGGQSR